MTTLSEAVLSKYELTTVLGTRIQQVCNGGALFVERKEHETIPDAVQRELLERRTPLMLVRTMPNGVKKKYRVSEMVIREDLMQPTGNHV